MKVSIINNEVNFTGLTFRQFALLEKLINESGNEGGYKIDLDEYELMQAAIHEASANDLFDLEAEKEEIEKKVRAIMAKYEEAPA